MPQTGDAVDVCLYRNTGLLYPIPVLNASEIERYRGLSDELELRLGGKPRTVEVRQMHLHLPWAWELAAHPRVLDAVEAVLGPDILVWATELFAKHPEDAAISIEWHRDRPYMGFEGDGVATAWIALSDSDRDNGCMQALPGPDRKVTERGESPPVDVVLQAGEMSLHDADMLHGSAANLSPKKRVGFAVRYVTPESYRDCGKSTVLAARGSAPRNGCLPAAPPGECDWERAIAGLKKSAGAHFDVILQNLQRAEQ